MTRFRVPGRPLAVVDDVTLFYDDDVLVTWDRAFTAVEVPLVPYGFLPRDEKVALGWRSTLALAALGSGGVDVKVARRPFSPGSWVSRTDERVREVGVPGSAWEGHLKAQAARMEQVQAASKHVVVLRELGRRSVAAQWASRTARGPVPRVGSRELEHWRRLAVAAREGLARSLGARPVDAPTLQWVRRHALLRGLTPPRPSATGRRAWGRGEVVDEFADVELTPLARGVRVDSPLGSAFTATLVTSAFPQRAQHPDSPPWLAHLDWVGAWAEADLRATLVPPRTAARDVLRRQRLAQDQRREAAEVAADLPLETERLYDLARDLEDAIPQRRLPLVYGWGRVRVDAGSEDELAERCARVTERFADENSPHVDLSLPSGMAQVDLLVEGVPGQPVKHKSWRQRWTVEAVGCSLPHAGSNLAHSTGMYVGPTTGRYVQAATLDVHHGITRRAASDVEGPGGCVLLGNQRAGKSSALGRIIDDATLRGYTTVAVDFSGPLARLASLPRYDGRMQVLNLMDAGGGVLDPMSPAVIPGDAQRDRRVREQRKHLTRDVLTLLAWKQLAQSAEAETEMLRAISEVATVTRPSMMEVVERLGRTRNAAAQGLAEHLRFELSGDLAEAMSGDGGSVDGPDGEEPTTRLIIAPGLPLPSAGVPVESWTPSEALGSAMFSVAAHLAHRLLWDLPPHHLKLLVVDEAHIAMNTEAGRRVVEKSLRDGPKHGCAVLLATHNAVDLADERIVNALGTKMLFRSTADTELERAIRVAGLEDTPTLRRQIRGLRNGECILRTDDGVTDRVQWDRYDPELAEVLNTTPSGRRQA